MANELYAKLLSTGKKVLKAIYSVVTYATAQRDCLQSFLMHAYDTVKKESRLVI